MNYLGHAYLSFGDAEILTGNMIGDHVKGSLILDSFPEGVRKGIVLHRKIDEFSDNHPATMRGKVWFREKYGLYAGAVMDVLYDHFLANDAKLFNSEPELLKFTQDTYAKMEQNAAVFPSNFATYFGYMREHNWLYNYRTVKGVEKALNGLMRRAQHIDEVDTAYKIFISHYYMLAQCYYELIDDLTKFVKIELSK